MLPKRAFRTRMHPKPQMTNLKLWKFEICHLWFWVRFGCEKPFLATFSESLKNLKDFSYLDRFCTGWTHWDILTSNLAKKAILAYWGKNCQKHVVWSKNAKKGRKMAETPQNCFGGRLGSKVLQKKGVFLPIDGRYLAEFVKKNGGLAILKKRNFPNFGQNWPKNNICWKTICLNF